MRKVYIELTTKIILNIEDNVDVNDVVNEMEYDFKIDSDQGEIVDTEILDYSIIDSK
jgi:hypothetical protein